MTSNAIQRVYNIAFEDGGGTCFLVDVDHRQYLITAEHVVRGFKDGDYIEIYYNGGWVKIHPKLIGHHATADVSVLTLPEYLSGHPMEASVVDMTYGQDVYFLGFPYDFRDEKNSLINRNFPIPLIKKAIVSALLFGEKEGDYFLLDGYNNPGFSGGPVIFRSPKSRNWKVAGIISGFHNVEEPTFFEDEPTNRVIRVNTGIILAYSICNALGIIKNNPNGIGLS